MRPEKVAHMESVLGVPLPPDYRRFLLEIGPGAGPYYGMWSPKEALTEIMGLVEDEVHIEGRPLHPSAPFPLGLSSRSLIDVGGTDGIKDGVIEAYWPCSGCVPICHQGCTFWSVLVLTGEFRGRVWDVGCYGWNEGMYSPARRASGLLSSGMDRRVLPPLTRPPTFGEWFLGWLARCLADLPE
ncbi:MAG: SMI1/KNR4 family protein [Planctomycetota bacterium]